MISQPLDPRSVPFEAEDFVGAARIVGVALAGGYAPAVRLFAPDERLSRVSGQLRTRDGEMVDFRVSHWNRQFLVEAWESRGARAQMSFPEVGFTAQVAQRFVRHFVSAVEATSHSRLVSKYGSAAMTARYLGWK